MAEKPNISDRGGERTIFRSRLSVPIGVFYTSLCISFVGLVYSLSFSTGRYESSNFVTSHAIVTFLFLGYLILRDFRTLLYVTDKRIVQKSGILLRSTKTMDLEDLDIPLLQHSVTRFGAIINSVSGARISLWGVHNRYDAIRAILEVTGNEAPPKIERSATNRLLIYKVFLVLGCCVCLSLWSFSIAGTMMSDDGFVTISGAILIAVCIPIVAGIGLCLGSIVVILVFLPFLTEHEAVEFLTSEYLVPGGKGAGRMTKFTNRLYEIILTWRYGRPVKLPL